MCSVQTTFTVDTLSYLTNTFINDEPSQDGTRGLENSGISTFIIELDQLP